MNTVSVEILGWLAYLQRPSVQLQIVPLLLVFIGLAIWRRRRRRWPHLIPAILAAQVLLVLLLMAAGQRWGLLLLSGQITLAWMLMRLLEARVLPLLLPPPQRHALDSRLLRPAWIGAVVLVLLDALGSLDDLRSVSLGVWFGSPISLGQVCWVVVVLYVVLVGLDLSARGLSALLQRSLRLSDGSRRAIDQILRYVIVSLAVVWALTRLGFDRTGLLAVAGGLSVGLGFGIKEVVANIVSGLWLLIEGSVRPGDVLMHEGEACEVRRLGPRAAVLWRKADHAELVVPNQTFFTRATTTYTGSDRTRRCTIELAIPLIHAPVEVIAALEQIAASQPGVLADPPVVARLLEFGSDNYRYSLTYAMADPLHTGALAASVRLAIHQHFSERGIAPRS